jgi:hypothetical protein
VLTARQGQGRAKRARVEGDGSALASIVEAWGSGVGQPGAADGNDEEEDDEDDDWEQVVVVGAPPKPVRSGISGCASGAGGPVLVFD